MEVSEGKMDPNDWVVDGVGWGGMGKRQGWERGVEFKKRGWEQAKGMGWVGLLWVVGERHNREVGGSQRKREGGEGRRGGERTGCAV